LFQSQTRQLAQAKQVMTHQQGGRVVPSFPQRRQNLICRKDARRAPTQSARPRSVEASMARLFLAFLAVLAIIYLVPIIVYGAFQSMIGAEMPKGVSPLAFLTGVLVEKVGAAIAFCAIFYLARDHFASQWLLYAAIWWAMFAFGELGQLIGPNYSWKEALAGVISEAVYFPASAYVASLLRAG
jgi:hypothetical protein